MNDAKTIGSNALVLDTAEENVTVMNAEESKLGKEVSLIEQRAEAVVVASGADFEDAGLFLKQIKQAQKQVKDYWEPLRVSAKKSYDEVLTHRKEMIEPLEKAEKIVKVKVNEYSAEQERKRREQEEAMRRLAQAEIDRHLNEAAEAEANGDAVGAEYAMAEAEMMEGGPSPVASSIRRPRSRASPRARRGKSASPSATGLRFPCLSLALSCGR